MWWILGIALYLVVGNAYWGKVKDHTVKPGDDKLYIGTLHVMCIFCWLPLIVVIALKGDR